MNYEPFHRIEKERNGTKRNIEPKNVTEIQEEEKTNAN